MIEHPRICIVGAGAIGGLFAGRLAHAGNAISVLARGRTLEALRTHGMRLESQGQRMAPPVRASDDAAELGPQDIVIITVKAPALPEVARSIAPMVGADTIVIPALNGIPWWFFLAPGQPLAGTRLRSVDPEGAIETHLPLPQVLGAVVFASASTPEPGLSRHASGDRLVFGEPGGGTSARAETVAALFSRAGFNASASADVRTDIWTKLLGNACFNPVSMLTGAHTDVMIDDSRLHDLFVAMMEEALALGSRLGLSTQVSSRDRIAFTRSLGHVKTSMLQDVEAGRPVEIDSILGALVEAAGAMRFPTPALDAVYALARMRARMLGLYPG
ncbi:MAG: 2-dehydropantoate 2-reductase [Pigmentiphaga sp.]|uniref:ketopantoate reductase family protein n=1 Tax=Pigmentiphaga sp. TaxID=1977564 RepID=UPI0029B659D4|nr:2-dehydropantoate 2-reductase [Pigmentiphaga sp.]MDX3906033.1 2-dehydropantoate 2-reductase [Pigmentiphaga sp.]